MKKLLIMIIMLLCLTACTQDSEYPSLNGIGIDELVTFNVPDGFTNDGGDVSLNKKVVVQRHWKNDSGIEIGAYILVYDGQPIMCDPTTIDEFVDGEDVEIREYNGNRFFVVNGDDIDAYVEYDKYIMCFSISGNASQPEKNMFDEMLKSVKFTQIYDDPTGEKVLEENQKLQESLEKESE